MTRYRSRRNMIILCVKCGANRKAIGPRMYCFFDPWGRPYAHVWGYFPELSSRPMHARWARLWRVIAEYSQR